MVPLYHDKQNSQSQNQVNNSSNINEQNLNQIEMIKHNDPQIQKIIEAIQNGDKKVLDKILKGLEKAEKYQEMIETQNLDFSPKVLTETQVYRIIQSVIEMPEDKLIQKIKEQEQDVKEFFLENIKKRVQYIPNDQSIKILKAMMRNDKEQYHPIWKVFQNEFQKRLKTLSVGDLANLVYLYAHANKHTRQFFRDIENELIERQDEYIPVDAITKLLKGFSYSNEGSSMLYNKIAKTVKLAQHEIDPLLLANYAYHFSKASENIKAGFGVYHVAEKKIEQFLYRYNFTQLAKLSKYFMGQNIGSNKFLQRLEQELYEKYPIEIDPSQLVKICKATSRYYFQHKDKAVFFKLEADCIKYLEYMSSEQISEVIWSFSRGRSGSYVLYQLLEMEVLNRLKVFSLRNLAFIYHSFSISGRGGASFFEKLEEEILERELENFSSHYTIKMISGINVRNAYDSKLFGPLLQKLDSINEDSEKIRYQEIIQFLFMIVQAPPFYLEKQTIQQQEQGQEHLQQQNFKIFYQKFENLFQKFIPKLQQTLSAQRIDELCQTYIAYAVSNNGNKEFLQEILAQIPTAYDVPKTVFCQFIYALCIQQQNLEFAAEFMPIVQDLRDYGNIKFFFSHDDYVKLIYSCAIISQIETSSQNQQQIGSTSGYKTKNEFDLNFWDSCYTSLMEINPNTLKFQSISLYVQDLMFMLIKIKQSGKYKKTPEDFAALMQNTFQKIDQLTMAYKQEIVSRDLSALTDYDMKHDIFNTLNLRIENYFQRRGIQYQLIQNFVDELMNTVDVALFIQSKSQQNGNESEGNQQQQLQRIAVVILNQNHYQMKIKGEEGAQLEEYLLLNVQSKFSLMQDILEWNLIIIDEEDWKLKTREEKMQFFKEQIEFDDEIEGNEEFSQQIEDKSNYQMQQKKEQGKKSFKEKMQAKKQQQNQEN